MADIDAYVTFSFAKWIKIDGSKNRNNIKLWVKNRKGNLCKLTLIYFLNLIV